MNAVNILWMQSGDKNRTVGELFRGANRGFLNDEGNPDPVCRDFGGVASRSGPDFFIASPATIQIAIAIPVPRMSTYRQYQ